MKEMKHQIRTLLIGLYNAMIILIVWLWLAIELIGRQGLGNK